MKRWIPAVLSLLCACETPAPQAPPDSVAEVTDSTDPESPEADHDGTAANRAAEPTPSSPSAEPWLQELLAFDLLGEPTDARTIALGERLASPVTCPQPGTGCYVELELGGHTTQVHFGDDQALQVWGPIDSSQMAGWVTDVEGAIDRSPLRRVNATGTRPDRLWRDTQHVVLLHDHSGLPCGGFCPSMIWIAPPGHSAAPGYGF